MLDSRQWATILVFASVVLASLVFSSSSRHLWANVLRNASQPMVVTLIGLYFATLTLVIWAASALNWWNTSMIGDTVLWFMFAGVGLFFSALDAGEEESFFTKTFINVVRVAAIFEFFIGVATFGLLLEVAIQLVAAFLLLQHITHTRKSAPEDKYRWAMACLGTLLIAHTAVYLIRERANVDWGQQVRDFAFPLWMTVAVLPVIFLLAVFLGHSRNFVLISASSGVDQLSRRSQAGLIWGLGTDLGAIRAFTGNHGRAMAFERTFSSGRRAAASFKAGQRERKAAELATAARLHNFAGDPGVDPRGRRLGRREFEETMEELRRLSSYQMGRYNRDGRYDATLFELLQEVDQFEAFGSHHGFHMIVEQSGQAWFAFRRTITGWVLGIGAATGTPDRWFYDGPEPPTNPPPAGSSWTPELQLPSTEWD